MPLSFRTATAADLITIVRLLADDPLGARREQFAEPLPDAYHRAFAAIDADPNNQLLLAEQGGHLAGVLQLTFLPNLTYQGSWRAQIEGVRVAASMRSQGVGRALVAEAIARAQAKGCRLVQLTTDKQRPEAIAFYASLGFDASHEGMKRRL